MERKFITSECKIHYKLYKTYKKLCKILCKRLILVQKIYHLYHFLGNYIELDRNN